MPIDEARMVAMFIKIGAVFLFFHLAVIIKVRNPKYILNRILSTSFVFFGIYGLLDGVVYNIVSLSASWYAVGQIIFAIEYVLLFTFVFFQLNAAKIIRFGSRIMEKRKRLVVEAALLCASIIVFSIFSGVDVYLHPDILLSPDQLPPTGDFYVEERLTSVAQVTAYVPMIIYVHTLVILLLGILKSQSKPLIRRMLFMFIGLCLIPLGNIYFYIRGQIIGDHQIWTGAIGSLFEFLAAILVHFAVPRDFSKKGKRKIRKVRKKK